MEKCVNCWDALRDINATAQGVIPGAICLKSLMDWVISSQATEESVEGSTTNAYGPDRAMKRHECAPRKGRYSLIYTETYRATLNEWLLTQMNSVPYTGKLDALSEQPVKEIIHKVLKNDCKKTLDTAVHDQFKATVLRIAPTGGTNTSTVTLTTNGTCTETNNVALGKNHVKAIIDEMKERDIPPHTDDDYFCIARPSTFRSFKNDLEGVKEYTETGYGDIVRGEIGRYEGCRFVEQTNIAAGSGSTAGAAWTNSKSDWAFFMGEDTVAEAVAIPEEIRGKIPGDFGRDKGVAWYALLGYGIVHTAAAQSRIVMWDSAK